MPAKLRAFVSSTMEDLGNERRAVVARLREMNIEPVNAEDLPPNGWSNWEVLDQEIRSCELFILISGRSYGWVPTAGYGAGGKHSVTHLEALAARRNGLIMLPFFMKLKPKEKEDDQTRARDAFRKEIEDWAGGYFRQPFEWADELADWVKESVSSVLGQAFRREFQARSRPASVEKASFEGESPRRTDLHSIIASAAWVAPDAVLMAGAGMSLAAGYPSAPALMQAFLEEMGQGAQDADAISRLDFTEQAERFETQYGRATLLDRISGALLHADAFGPTRAHIAAVRVFKTIVTTNFDLLFEAACRAVGLPCAVVSPKYPGDLVQPPRGPIIFKVDGSIERPDSLVLTKRDAEAAATASWFRDAIEQRLKGHPLIVVGHALREAAAKRVPEAHVHAGGAYVTPYLNPALDGATLTLAGRYKLDAVRADADSFMIAYEQAIASRSRAPA